MDPNTSEGFTRGSSVDLIWFQVGCLQSDFILRFNIRKIWIEKIGPLKLFVVLVPGLLCNFGWEVTIKIHYSTVSEGGTLQGI